MKAYYKLTIRKTSKLDGNNSDWQTYDVIVQDFDTLAKVKNYLKEHYFYCKTKKPIYIDDKNGKAEKVGVIYCWKEGGSVQGDTGHYVCHDWVVITKHYTKFESVFV